MDISKEFSIKNLKNNVFILISALLYFSYHTIYDFPYYYSLLFSFIFVLIVCSINSSIWSYFKSSNCLIRIISFFSALGVCSGNFYENHIALESFAKFYKLSELCTLNHETFHILASILIFLPTFFLAVVNVIIYNSIIKIIVEVNKNLSKYEMALYGVILVLLITFVVWVFMQTVAFSCGGANHDVIYTGDSDFINRNNVYINLNNQENDIRQPLFSIFSTPFLGMVYFVSFVFDIEPTTKYLFLNIIQNIILLYSIIIISILLSNDKKQRMLFSLFMLSSYCFMLFSLMMEQYIIAFFWISLLFYSLCKRDSVSDIIAVGTIGTLSPGVCLLPFIRKHYIDKERLISNNLVRLLGVTIASLLLFNRWDLIYNLKNKLIYLHRFTGYEVEFHYKFYQYTEFVKNCFYYPQSAPLFHNNITSWQLCPIERINYVGIALVAVAFLSYLRFRHEISCQISIYWVLLSFIMLCVVGWGTSENGLILYSLYFGWPFFILTFKFATIFRIKDVSLYPLIIIAIVLQLYFNINAIMEMLSFAKQYYPL